ncbi:MAG: hypothetical protein WBD50_05745 [Candidatus Rhabdochlamydia sp.]
MTLKKKLRTCNFIVFRYASVQANPIIKIASDLVERTTYCTPALREHAPEKTDCLTAIHYIFKKALSVDMPLTFIGDMPRQLLSLENWSPIECNLENTQCGDIFFTKNKNRPKLISHIALIIEPDKIFHCTPLLGKAVIQSKEEFFSSYEQKLHFSKMICYIDPRNKELRSKQGMHIPMSKVYDEMIKGTSHSS